MVLLVLTFLLVLFDVVGFLNPVKNIGIAIGNTISADFKSNMSRFSGKLSLIEEKDKLLEKISALESEKVELISENNLLKLENRELELIKQQEQFTDITKSTPALVIGYVPDKFGHITINKGIESDVKNGDAVVIKNYLVGEVVRADQKVSEVRLITSQESLIPVSSMTNNTQGVSKGNINKGLLMQEIPQGGSLEEGEFIVTSGINSKFVRGLILGKVRSVDASANLATKTAELDLVSDFSELTEVFILDSVETL